MTCKETLTKVTLELLAVTTNQFPWPGKNIQTPSKGANK